MRKDEDSKEKSGDCYPENTYANLKDLNAQKPENNPKAEASKMSQDRLTLFLVIFLIVMFLILVIFTSLVFVYYNKITKEVWHVMNSVKEYTSHFENKLKQCKNETKPSCEIGWLEFDGHCYFFSDFQLNWARAEIMCLTKESHLVIITSEAEQTFLLNHINEKIYWIGMTDIDEEGKYRWVDGTLSPSPSSSSSSSSYTYWKNQEPNNNGGKENCIVLSKSDKWNDIECNQNRYAICEKRLI